jgi:hypothetical protein
MNETRSKLICSISVLLVSGCAAFTDPDPTNLATYCTAETGYRVGYLSKAYPDVCPKETEPAFLSGLQRGRLYRANPPQALPYYERMEQLEKQLAATTAEADRQRLRVQLADVEWQAIHIINSYGTYATGSSGRN